MSETTVDPVAVRLAQPDDAAALQAACFPMNTVEEVAAQLESNLAGCREGMRLPLVAAVNGTVAGHALPIRASHPLRQHRATWHDVVGAGARHRP